MLRSLWNLVVEIARGVDTGHAIWHGVPVQEAARRPGSGRSPQGDARGAAVPPSD